MKTKILSNCMILSILLLFNSALPGQDNYKQQAGKAMQSGKWAKAVELFEAHLKAHEEDASAWYLKGYCLVQNKKYETAIPVLKKASTLGYSSPAAVRFNLAKCHTQLGDYEKGMDILETAVNNGFSAYNRLKDPEFEPLQQQKRMAVLIAKAEKNAYPCLSDENWRRFDFWIGKWDVFASGKKVGESIITLAKGGCAIHESYTTLGPYSGQSINYYDPLEKKWKQNWVGNSGDVGIYEETDSGKGNLQFIAKQLLPEGVVTRKMTFYYNEKEDSVRQLIEDSKDEGKTFAPVFDGLYKRRGSK